MQEKGKIPWGYIIPALIVLAIIIGVIYIETNTHPAQGLLPGSFNWPVATVSGSLVIHLHPWLRIMINGHNVTIPAGIGCTSDNTGECVEPAHTHDNSGLIHIESEINTNYTLGQFFAIWNASYAFALVNGAREPIVFSNSEILGFKVNSSTANLKLLVDGKSPPAGDFNGSSSEYGNLVLNVLQYCSSSLPAYSFPCSPSDVGSNGAIGNPYWNGADGFKSSSNPNGYPYGGNHTILIEYTS